MDDKKQEVLRLHHNGAGGQSLVCTGDESLMCCLVQEMGQEVVMVFRKASRRRLWVVALAMNLLSYFLVAGSLNLLHPSSYGMRALFTPAAEAPAGVRPAELPTEPKPEADSG